MALSCQKLGFRENLAIFSQEQLCLLQSWGFFMQKQPCILGFLMMANVAASALC